MNFIAGSEMVTLVEIEQACESDTVTEYVPAARFEMVAVG